MGAEKDEIKMTFCEAFTKARAEDKAFKRKPGKSVYRVVRFGSETRIVQLRNAGKSFEDIRLVDAILAGNILADDWEVLE